MRISGWQNRTGDVVQVVFGAGIALAFDPFTYTGATSLRWALLAALLPLLCLFQSPKNLTLTHYLGILLVVWCAFTLIWTANQWDGLGELFQLVIVGVGFVYGSKSRSLKPIFCGIALGLALSSAMLILPFIRTAFSFSVVQVYPNGLFGNRNMLAEASVLAALGCLVYRTYWLIIPTLPAIFWQPMSRGALLALLAGFACWLWPRSRAATGVLAGLVFVGIVAAIGLDYRASSVIERIEIWQALLSHVTLSGHGIGSLFTLTPYLSTAWDTVNVRVDHAHNEFIEILFELGIPGLVIYCAILIAAIRSTLAQDALGNIGPVLAGFLVISCVAFPWHIPTSAFIGAIVLGHSVRNGADLRSMYADGRAFLCGWIERKYYAAAGH